MEIWTMPSASNLARNSQRVHSLTMLLNNRSRLNFVSMFCQRLPETCGQLWVMQDHQIGIMRRVIVVLPGFIPPAETNDPWPAPAEELLQRRPCPIRCANMMCANVATEFRDYDRFAGREFR